MPSDKRERRGHFRGKPRPGRRVEVSFAGAEGEAQRAYTRNIGVGGAFVVTDAPAAPGTALTLLVHVPTATEPVSLRAEVRWVTQGGDFRGMGVRFEGVGVEAALQLNEYFASLTGRDEPAG